MLRPKNLRFSSRINLIKKPLGTITIKKKMTIERIIIPENDILKYNKIEKYFNDKNNVLKVSKNNKIEFELIQNLIDNSEFKPNLYGILIKELNSEEWELKYIGQRKSKFIKDRLRQHLIKKHIKTGAQLDNVNRSLKIGRQIGIKLFAVEPDELRQYYEQKLLQNIQNVNWNKQK